MIATPGRIVWACLPKPDADPVFCALLRRDGGDSVSGVFAVDLRDMAQAKSGYLRNTAIVETTLTDAMGNSLKITDFCPRFRSRGRNFRPMAIVRLMSNLHQRSPRRQKCVCGRDATTAPTIRGASPAATPHSLLISVPLNYRLTTNSSLSPLLDESHFVRTAVRSPSSWRRTKPSKRRR